MHFDEYNRWICDKNEMNTIFSFFSVSQTVKIWRSRWIHICTFSIIYQVYSGICKKNQTPLVCKSNISIDQQLTRPSRHVNQPQARMPGNTLLEGFLQGHGGVEDMQLGLHDAAEEFHPLLLQQRALQRAVQQDDAVGLRFADLYAYLFIELMIINEW